MPDQPELRQRLTDALMATQMSGILMPGEAQHFADVLLALPGIAITPLPQPLEGGEDWKTAAGHDVWINPLTGFVRFQTSQFDPSEARSVAAALLAAAGVAEEQTNA